MAIETKMGAPGGVKRLSHETAHGEGVIIIKDSKGVAGTVDGRRQRLLSSRRRESLALIFRPPLRTPTLAFLAGETATMIQVAVIVLGLFEAPFFVPTIPDRG
jgi:hypothetical protein